MKTKFLKENYLPLAIILLAISVSVLIIQIHAGRAATAVCQYTNGLPGSYVGGCSDCSANGQATCQGTLSNCSQLQIGPMCYTICDCSSFCFGGSGLSSIICDGNGGNSCQFNGSSCQPFPCVPASIVQSVGLCPPINPSPNNSPAASSIKVTQPNYCNSGPAATVVWVYSDLENESQIAYQVQVDNSGSSFNNPLFDSGQISGTSTAYFVSGLPFAATLKARVRVWDANGVSNWTTSASWKTPKHAYPLVNFNWTPANPLAKNPVQFTDLTMFYDGTSKHSWSWTFGDGGSSMLQNPIHTYNAAGSYDVTDIATDKDGYTCSLSQVINVQKPIPQWREINPK